MLIATAFAALQRFCAETASRITKKPLADAQGFIIYAIKEQLYNPAFCIPGLKATNGTG